MDQSSDSSSVFRQLAGFVAFSHGWTWALWSVVLIRGGAAWEWPNAAFLVAGGLGVPIGGVVMTWRDGGRRALRDLTRRCLDLRLPGVRWWGVAVLLFPASTLAAGGLHRLAGGTGGMDAPGLAQMWSDPAGFALTAGFVLVAGPLPEEIGWRGYALDRLQRRWSALGAALAVGGLWATWHVPLYALEGYYSAFGGGPPDPVEHLAGVLFSSVLYAWIYARSGRSVLAVIVFHFFQNFSGRLLGATPATDRVHFWLLAALALGVILVEGADLGLDANRQRGGRVDLDVD